jgi:steroid delta-isomerase-like uncharacterized protein
MESVMGLDDQHPPGRSPHEQQNVKTALMMFAEGWGAIPGWQDVWRAHAAGNMMSFFNGNPDPQKDLEQFLTFQAELFGGFPTLQTQVTDVTAEADTVVVQSMLEGTHDGEFLGVPASGARVKIPDVTIFRLKNNKIVEVKYFTDLLIVMTMIGRGV